MRMNKTLLAEIVSNIVKDTVQKKIDASEEKMQTIGDKIADRLIEFDGATEAVKNLPAHYFEEKEEFRVMVSDAVVKGDIHHRRSFNEGNGAQVYRISKHRSRVYFMIYSPCHVLSHDDEDIVAYLEVRDVNKSFQQEFYAARDNLTAMLTPFKTVEALIKDLPDFTKYVPAHALESPVKALAVRAEDITSYVNGLAA
ncbi:Nmad5 family putative nucleotide modification protein [Methylobacter sp.]